MKKYAEKNDACKCGHRFFCAEKTARRLQTNQLGFVGVFLERTKYRIRVGRGLAPAAEFEVN